MLLVLPYAVQDLGTSFFGRAGCPPNHTAFCHYATKERMRKNDVIKNLLYLGWFGQDNRVGVYLHSIKRTKKHKNSHE